MLTACLVHLYFSILHRDANEQTPLMDNKAHGLLLQIVIHSADRAGAQVRIRAAPWGLGVISLYVTERGCSISNILFYFKHLL